MFSLARKNPHNYLQLQARSFKFTCYYEFFKKTQTQTKIIWRGKNDKCQFTFLNRTTTSKNTNEFYFGLLLLKIYFIWFHADMLILKHRITISRVHLTSLNFSEYFVKEVLQVQTNISVQLFRRSCSQALGLQLY